MKNKKNIYKSEIPATSAKTPALKYILIVVLLIAAAGNLVVAKQLEDIRKRNRG